MIRHCEMQQKKRLDIVITLEIKKALDNICEVRYTQGNSTR